MRNTRRGATLPLVALTLITLCGCAAFAVDMGVMYHAKARAQSITDAAALYAVKFLGTNHTNSDAAAAALASVNSASGNLAFHAGNQNSTSLTAYPTSYTADNGSTVTVGANTVIEVQGYVDTPLPFISLVGDQSTAWDNSGLIAQSVPARSYAQIGCPSSVTGSIMPFGIVVPSAPINTSGYTGEALSEAVAMNEMYYEMNPSTSHPQINFSQYQAQEVMFKADKWGSSSFGIVGSGGNFGWLGLPGFSNGAKGVSDAIEGPETTALSVGETIDTKPGNVQSETSAINYRTSESAYDPTNDGISHTAYDTWYNGTQTYDDSRIVLVPLVTPPDKSGKAQVTVLGFAGVFLEGAGSGDTWTTTDPATETQYTWTAANGDIFGRFIAVIFSGSFGGGACVAAPGTTIGEPQLIGAH